VFGRLGSVGPDDFDPLARDDAGDGDERREFPRPLIIGGALTSAAISLAGAAYVAWRRARPARARGAMVRAARAVRNARVAAAHARFD
jgi:hypothetical protein